MDINLHIERLVLDGVPISYGQRHLLQAAVEGDLAHLLAEGGLAPSLLSGGALASVKAGSIQLTAGNSPTELGGHIAQALYEGIRR